MKRYQYPVGHKKDVSDDVPGAVRIISPCVGVVMCKGPRAERSFVPDTAARLRNMWNTSCLPDVPLHACFACGLGLDAGELRSCAFCLLSSHKASSCPSTASTWAPPVELPEVDGDVPGPGADLETLLAHRFGADNMCFQCSAAFGVI